MGNKNFLLILFVILLLGIVAASFFLLPQVNWGRLQLLPGKTITVIGEAKTSQKNQIAIFTASVTSTKDNKDEAVTEVNQKIQTIIDSVKAFGINPDDIKTQRLDVYQKQETYYEGDRQKTRAGQWQVTNSIEVKLRDANRTSELADLFTKSGATSVYGPNFSLEDVSLIQTTLLEEAVSNARKKAEVIARSSGRKLGKIISVSEGSQPVSLFESRAGGGGGQPGTSAVLTVVTVVFELE